ncbi:MAG: SDR family NAD(P)-dependent oxidoreductase [Actinomycetota bacterium]
MSTLASKYGPWAVVTGASSGIGREFARTLGEEGFNLVVAARRLDRLETLAEEIGDKNGVEVRPFEVDLSTASGVDRLEAATDGLDVGLVISNAGSSPPGSFLNTNADAHRAFVELNTTTPMLIGHSFGHRMVERGRGGIVFVSSTAAFTGTPYLANYAATKAYQLTLGEGLHAEYGEKGVDVLVLVPGPTRTEMTDVDGVDFSVLPMSWMDPEDVAAAALGALGRKPVLVPGRINRVMRFATTHLMSRRASVSMWGSMMRKATDDALV